jgi:plasmid stability protein
MTVNLSIKGVPDALADRLRRRAMRNHRSLQRELMALLEAAAAGPDRPAPGSEAPVLLSAEPVAGYATAHPLPAGGNNPSTVDAGADELLGELDQIVEGSRWGHAPLLDRERLHDRALARELDFDSREAELRQARAGRPPAAD